MKDIIAISANLSKWSIKEEDNSSQEGQARKKIKVSTAKRYQKKTILHSDNDEDDKNENSVVILPGPLDIIMESGRHNKNNPVNIQLKNLIDTYYDLYNATKPKKKNQRWYVIYSNKYALGS